MPKAYRAAPAPVCALLSGVAENIGIVLFYKLFVATVQPPDGFMVFVAGLGLISSLVAGGVAIQARTTRGTLAYSTISQLGFIFLGLAMVSYYGILGGLLYVLAHAVAKSGLFFAFGLAEDSAGTSNISEMGGLAKRAPALAAATAMLAFAIIGLPPFLGFFAKLGVIVGALKGSLLLGVGAAVGALFTVVYMVRLYSRVFLGCEPKNGKVRISGFLTALVVLMALVSLAGGVLAFVPVRLLDQSVVSLVGGM